MWACLRWCASGLALRGLGRGRLFYEALQHGEDGFAFGLLGGGIGFDVVVVVGKDGGGIDFGSGAEREFDVVFADILQPEGVAQALRIFLRGFDGFVDDIPGMDAAFVAADHRLDVRGEEGDGVLLRNGSVEPGGLCSCQQRLWPRAGMWWDSAKSMKKSACVKSKRSCSGCVARHFIWFSATRMEHWSRRSGVKSGRLS